LDEAALKARVLREESVTATSFNTAELTPQAAEEASNGLIKPLCFQGGPKTIIAPSDYGAISKRSDRSSLRAMEK
jgi:hypothetical protein